MVNNDLLCWRSWHEMNYIIYSDKLKMAFNWTEKKLKSQWQFQFNPSCLNPSLKYLICFLISPTYWTDILNIFSGRSQMFKKGAWSALKLRLPILILWYFLCLALKCPRSDIWILRCTKFSIQIQLLWNYLKSLDMLIYSSVIHFW